MDLAGDRGSVCDVDAEEDSRPVFIRSEDVTSRKRCSIRREEPDARFTVELGV